MKILQYNVTETGIILPSTGIAANAIDEDVEVAETDERVQVPLNGPNGSEDRFKTSRLPFPPLPPPIPQNAYMQVVISEFDPYIRKPLLEKHIFISFLS